MNLRQNIIRLAVRRPELRGHLVPLIRKTASMSLSGMKEQEQDALWRLYGSFMPTFQKFTQDVADILGGHLHSKAASVSTTQRFDRGVASGEILFPGLSVNLTFASGTKGFLCEAAAGRVRDAWDIHGIQGEDARTIADEIGRWATGSP